MSDLAARKDELIKALCDCEKLKSPEGREDCKRRLLKEIRDSIPDRADTRSHVEQFVETCLRYPTGIVELERAVKFYEDGTRQMPRVHDCFVALRAAMDAAAAEAVAAATTDARAVAGRPGTAASAIQDFTLIVGISKYKYGKAPRTELSDREFPNLSFAADDAAELFKLLNRRGYKGPAPLLNEDATLRGILQALETLRKQCRQADNPLVVVFFSGHGARDADGQDFLVPYDGERNNLFATALWSKTLDHALRELNTRRLVVFLDACHAGAIGAEGVKGELQPCDPEAVLAREDGRYVIASCLANQLSRELPAPDGGRGHGIFSHQLLQLLRSEREEDSDREEVELFSLSRTLKERVLGTTNGLQEPWTNVDRTTDIILAINQARRQKRIAGERALLDAIDRELTAREYEESELVRDALLQFIRDGAPAGHPRARFFKYFRQNAAAVVKYGPPSADQLRQICDRLIDYYSGRETLVESLDARHQLPTSPDADRTAPPPSVPTTSAVSAAPQPADADRFDRGMGQATERKVDPRDTGASRTADTAMAAVVRASRPAPQSGTDRRRFSREDTKYVLAPIWVPEYFREIGSLKAILERAEGVSKEDFTGWLVETHPAEPHAAAEWTDRCASLLDRFNEKWEMAEKTTVFVTQHAVGLRTGSL